MSPEARVGIYYCPDYNDPLFAAGAAWLGRDPRYHAPIAQPDLPGIEEVTAEARGYGFHATMKPPFRISSDRTWNELQTAARALARRFAPFELPALSVTELHGFLALRESSSCAALQALADACVVELDRFRAPPSDAELARRRRAGLTEAQEAMLARFGYPYVLETWFFHMTLTRRLSSAEHQIWRPAAERYFAAAAGTPRLVTDICLFSQTGPGAPFVITGRVPLQG
jgi:putative phosphonate metabolism protein